MITLILEALFALVFLRALLAYARSRDPIHRDVAVVFSALTVLFVLELAKRLDFVPPAIVGGIAGAWLLGQPYFTLRLVSRLRRVPRWQRRAALGAYVITAAPFAIGYQPMPVVVVLAAIGVFFVTEVLAAVYFALEAKRRSGSPRIRLLLAAVGTGALALALLAAGGGAASEEAKAATGTIAQVVALVSAIGYVVAFVPPNWLRGLWSATASYAVSQQLMQAPATEPPRQTWHRYAATVCDTAGADGAIVLLYTHDGGVAEIASSDMPLSGERVTPAELDRLLAVPQPVEVARDKRAIAPTLAVEYANRIGARYVNAVPLNVPPEGRGALILLNQHRRLFSDDDVRMLGSLGTQAGILAERGNVLAEQERLTAELAESIEALKRASQAKSDFLASMSHELRTPLNSIIGFSELMRAEEEVGDQRLVPDEWIEHIHSSGRRLLALINDILDLTKVESGRMELRLEPIDLPGAIRDVLASLRPVADKKQLELISEVPEIAVQADRVRFRQILDNLLSNAIKFTPDGGKITVSAKAVINMALISVTDTGTGIAADDLDRVFEEFQQVGDAAARQNGTGLGLALTRRLVQAHGGKIELTSELGRGSTFTIHVPLAHEDTIPEPPAVEHTGAAHTGGILVIEDEPGAARLLRTYLEEAGYGVTIAATGEAGLDAARTCAPQAIVLDVLLPGIDGWEVLRRLKADPQIQDIPVVIVTVVDEEEVGLALGAVDYFVKPIERDMLLDRLARHTLVPASVPPSGKVLVIDDDPGTLEIVDASLRQQGYDVVTSATGAEGLRIARSQPFDLIICDLLMPDMDGFSVIAALEADPKDSRAPIVVFTAHDISAADQSRLDGRVLGVIRKGEAAQAGLRDWLNWLANQTPHPVSLHKQGAS